MFFITGIKDGLVQIADSEDGVVEAYTVEDTLRIAKQVSIKGVNAGNIRVYHFEDMIARDKILGYESNYCFFTVNPMGNGVWLCNVTGATNTIRISNVVKGISERCFFRSAVEKVILPKSVKVIGREAFRNCGRLEEINLDSVESIGSSAFIGCMLKEVHSVSVKNVGSDAFCECKDLREVYLPNAVIIDEGAFQTCYNLKRVVAPKVEKIKRSAFENCLHLQEVNLPNATIIDECAFRFCSDLKRVVAPRVSEIEYATFMGCRHLEYVQFDNLHDIGKYAFQGCSTLKDIHIHDKCSWKQNSFDCCPAELLISRG